MARELGRMDAGPDAALTAASGLLRCAGAADQARASALHAEALDQLEAARRAGGRVEFDRPEYAPLREDARFQRIASRGSGG